MNEDEQASEQIRGAIHHGHSPRFRSVMARLTPKQVAEFLNLSMSKIYELCQRREIEHYRLGSTKRARIFFEQAQVEEFLARCRVTTSACPSEESLHHLNLQRPVRRGGKHKAS